MSDIHQRLEEVRERENLSRRAFAKEIGGREGYSVSHSSVGQYESDTTVPAAYAGAVCSAFGINPRWLILGQGVRGDMQPSEAEEALAEIAAVIEALDDRGVGEPPEESRPAS